MGDTCSSRCQKNKGCQDALVADGIAPAGSFDSGLCNGICSALRTSAREAKKLEAELGLSPTDVEHPCLPSKANKTEPSKADAPKTEAAPAP